MTPKPRRRPVNPIVVFGPSDPYGIYTILFGRENMLLMAGWLQGKPVGAP